MQSGYPTQQILVICFSSVVCRQLQSTQAAVGKLLEWLQYAEPLSSNSSCLCAGWVRLIFWGGLKVSNFWKCRGFTWKFGSGTKFLQLPLETAYFQLQWVDFLSSGRILLQVFNWRNQLRNHKQFTALIFLLPFLLFGLTQTLSY